MNTNIKTITTQYQVFANVAALSAQEQELFTQAPLLQILPEVQVTPEQELLIQEPQNAATEFGQVVRLLHEL